MKFYISRTSQWKSQTSPCDKAILLNPNKEEWEEYLWGIEINSLEELIELREKVGEDLIILHTYKDKEYSEYELEIYDTYRE